MRTRILMLSAYMPFAIAVFTSCNNSPKTSEDTAAKNGDTMAVVPMSDTSNAAQQEWEKFKVEARDKIRENSDSMQALNARMKKTGKKMEKGFDKRMDELKEKNDELKARLDTFKMEGKEKWEKFKGDFNRDMDTLSMKWKNLVEKKKNS